MRIRIALLTAVLALSLGAQEAFLVKPYLQLGDAPAPAAKERLDLLWHAADKDETWTVEVRLGKAWVPQAPVTSRRLEAPPLPPHRICRVTLRDLPPAAKVPYRVKQNGKVVFEAEAQTRTAGAHRMVVLGDIADGSPNQAAIAKALAAQHPDAVFIAGDLVYGRGRASEYRKVFYPIYNGEDTVMARVPFLGMPGNHDIPFSGFEDSAAFYAYWSLPLNGPALKPGDPGAAPVKAGVHDAMVAAAGSAFPRMASFSFDWGPVHWTVLDSDTYADWDSPVLKAWLEADLAAAKGAAWRIVALHHPLFQSSKSHFDDQWMRPISPILEKHGVSLVFAGHVHNYQRTAPLRFSPTKVGARRQPVEGTFTVDEAFDGRTVTRPKGIIHIVTGAGGADLYDPKQTLDKASWQPWTRAFISDRHSFTVLDVEAGKLRLRQLDAQGRELDGITLTK